MSPPDHSLPAVLFLVYSVSMIPLAFFASVFISTIRLAGKNVAIVVGWLKLTVSSLPIVNIGMLIFVIGLMIISILSESRDVM